MAALAAAASAQQFPSKPVTLICPWPPGGSTDIGMRALAEATRQVPRPAGRNREPACGAAGTLGAGAMLNAKPDGYTVTQIPLTVFRLPHLEKTPFDPLADLTYILGVLGLHLRRRGAERIAVEDLERVRRLREGELRTRSRTARRVRIPLSTSPWKSSGSSRASSGCTSRTRAGRRRCRHCSAATSIRSRIPPPGRPGQRRQAAPARDLGREPDQERPDVPTLKELGYGIVQTSPYGLAGPKGMDPRIVQILHDAFKRGMEDPIHTSVARELDQDLAYSRPRTTALCPRGLRRREDGYGAAEGAGEVAITPRRAAAPPRAAA